MKPQPLTLNPKPQGFMVQDDSGFRMEVYGGAEGWNFPFEAEQPPTQGSLILRAGFWGPLEYKE